MVLSNIPPKYVDLAAAYPEAPFPMNWPTIMISRAGCRNRLANATKFTRYVTVGNIHLASHGQALFALREISV